MNSIGLYLHVPFCRQKCSYCDFYSLPSAEGIPVYEKALCRAVESFREELSDYTVESVYLGGGTPSLLSPEGIEAILSSVAKSTNLSREAEITCEMNPESASDAVLRAAYHAGVNRISLGMQSSLDEELRLLGRIHSARDCRDAVLRARRAGFENISLDLMYGLPHQKADSFRRSVEEALSLGIRHLSFYLLTLSPDTPLYALRDSLPDEETVREMYFSALEILERFGFYQYEISNAALPGFFSRHNLRYWQGGEYLGIGPCAHSLFRNERFRMEEGVKEFILASNPRDRIRDREVRSREDCRTECLMLSLRTAEGLSFASLSQWADEEFCRSAESKLKRFASFGLAKKTSMGYALTPQGFLVSNEIISELI